MSECLSEDLILVTPTAKDKLLEFILNKDLNLLGIRICFKVGGCSGISHSLEFASKDNIKDSDVIINLNDEYNVYVDIRLTMSLLGSIMDFESSVISSGFIFKRKNKTGCCGAGLC